MTNGEVRQLQKGSEDELSLILGDMLKSVLFKSRDTGLFASLPKAKQCHIGMEEFDGTHYGWPPYEDRGKIDLI